MIRIGIVGCGRILAAHLRGYRLLREAGIDDFRITALCSRKEADARMYLRRGADPPQRPAVSDIPGDPLAIGDEYLSDFQNDVDVQVYTNYRQMIAQAPIDALNDFSTHALHHQIAEEALTQGKDLLSQKPLAITIRAARHMCQLAESHERIFGVFENFRQTPRTRYLRWLFNSGKYGKLQMILLGYAAAWWAPNRIVAETPWRHRKNEAGGISLDLGVHFFDQIRQLAGEIRSVTAQTAIIEPRRFLRDAQGNLQQEMDCDADDTFFASIETEQGAVGNMFASWGGHGPQTLVGSGTIYYGSQCRVDGDQVCFDAGPPKSLEKLYREEASLEQQNREFPLGLSDSFALNQLDWLKAVRDRRPPETSGEEGLKDLAAAYSILESATAQRKVDVAQVLSGELDTYQRPINAFFGIH